MGELEAKAVVVERDEEGADVLVHKYVFGFVEMEVIKCAVELGIAEAIDANGHPMTLPELSKALGCSLGFLHRIMRFLVHRKIFKEICSSDGGTRSYGLTSLSRHLIKGEDRGMRALLKLVSSPPMVAPWDHLAGAVRENGLQPFVAAHGEPLWGYAEKHPELRELLNDVMACDTRMALPAIVEGCAEFLDGVVRSIVDVGGSDGTTLRALIKIFPTIKGINFDLPHVAAAAPQIKGVEHVGGDMFESIPKADIVLIKWVLHNWGDEQCINVLRNCREAVLDSSNGKVIIVESVINEDEDYKFKHVELMVDIVMMVQTTQGKERTRAEWGSILDEAGFSRFYVKPIQALQSLIIAYP